MSAEQAHDLLCRFRHLVEALQLWPALYESSTSDGQIHYIVRQGEGNDYSMFCVQATLQGVALRSLYELLSRVENRKLWDTSFEAGQVLEELPNDFSAAYIEYIRLAGIFPVVKQRDMVVLSINAQMAAGEIISASTSVQSSLAPSKKGYQRFNLSIGGCMLREVPDGVELTQITDIGDLVKWTPAYVIRTCTQVLVPRFLTKVRKEALALSDDLDTSSTTKDWKPPMRSQSEQRPVIVSGELETPTPLVDAVNLETIEHDPDEALNSSASEDAGWGKACTLLSQPTMESVDTMPRRRTLDEVALDEVDVDHKHITRQNGDGKATENPATDAQQSAFQDPEKVSSANPVSASPLASSSAEALLLDSHQEAEEVIEPLASSSPLPLPRLRATSGDLSQLELAMRRLSYFGGDEDQYGMDEELESILPEALNSSTGLQAAHRLSRALAQYDLARKYGDADEGIAAKSTSVDEHLKFGEAAAADDEEALLIQEIRDAAQPFFSSSIEGLLFTPSTHLAVKPRRVHKQVPPSWLETLSSVLYYLPGSTLFARSKR